MCNSKIRLRKDTFRKIAKSKWNAETNAEIAAALGLAETSVMRVLNGTAGPGERFIAAALKAIPEWGFADLFEVYDVTGTREGDES